MAELHTTLYRKYRPQVFGEVVGQELITEALKNAITGGRIGHTYLFAGPRGLGKTTLARILAKAVNCPNAEGGEPCGECEICESIAEGSAIDVHEFDAASHRSVEEIQDILLANVRQAPVELNYKVYIIDEVHMISRHAFNSLLKVFEEPPEHVIFVLCTTEPDQIPITIRSRCLSFQFRRIPLGALAEHLAMIAESEGYSLDEEGAMTIARLAEGSARDALSLLEQVMNYTEDEITKELILEAFGVNLPEQIAGVTGLLCAGAGERAVAEFNEQLAAGKDPEDFLYQLADLLKTWLTDREELVKRLPEENREELQDALGGVPRPRLLQALDEIWSALKEVRLASHTTLLTESLLIHLSGVLTGEREVIRDQPAETAEQTQQTEEAPELPDAVTGGGEEEEEDTQEDLGADEVPTLSGDDEDAEPTADETETGASDEAEEDEAEAPPPEPVEIDEYWLEVLAEVEQISTEAWAVLARGVTGLEETGDGYELKIRDDNRFAGMVARSQTFVHRALSAALAELGDDTDLAFAPDFPDPQSESLEESGDGEEEVEQESLVGDQPSEPEADAGPVASGDGTDSYDSAGEMVDDLLTLDPDARVLDED